VPLLDCSNEGVVHAFLNKVINKFGTLVEILTNQDTKLCGEFQKSCEEALIDHFIPSQYHFKTNRWCK
jgi:hypothetical protein